MGADIDAVGAISSVPASVPEPTASSLLVAALALAWLFTSRLRSGAGAPGPRPAPA
ncbi:MAG: PEP-CTERM sorting domain-containing protein [Betaproteobacteria bacterium]|nr:PEP-CTERM sorting domain-containing protein [Betaproteobacteria bacterium]